LLQKCHVRVSGARLTDGYHESTTIISTLYNTWATLNNHVLLYYRAANKRHRSRLSKVNRHVLVGQHRVTAARPAFGALIHRANIIAVDHEQWMRSSGVQLILRTVTVCPFPLLRSTVVHRTIWHNR